MMVNYEEEYDKFEDTPNNIDYGSWYEYDNFQDFIDGKNALFSSDSLLPEQHRTFRCQRHRKAGNIQNFPGIGHR